MQLTAPRSAAGFSLIEVLVALVLLSVGLLGLAGLQTASLKNSGSALVRSQAVAMGYSILDKIRANRANADAYLTGFDDEAPKGESVAAKDLHTWKNRLQTLPGGQGVIKEDASGTFIVSVRWKARPALDGAGNGEDDEANAFEAITLRTRP